MAAWLKLVPSWAWWVLALLAVGGVQQLRVAGAQVQAAGAVASLAGYKTEVSERDRKAALAALQETKRRMAAIDEVQKDAEQQLEAARADAAGAGAALERLQQRLTAAEQRSRAAGNTITTQLGQAAESAARVRAELLGGMGKMAGLYADQADRSRIAGTACERSYDALSP
nr:DUF2514 family protein [uncultured Pseudomonas sp.]